MIEDNGLVRAMSIPFSSSWDGLVSRAEGETSAGLASFDRITNRVAIQLPITARLAIHNMTPIPESSSNDQLETAIDNLQKSANATAVIQAAQILWLTGNPSQA
jgi:hypothetical protein